MRVTRLCCCLLLGALACGPLEEPDFATGSSIRTSISSSASSGSNTSTTDESGTEATDTGSLDMAGCDPLLDPLEECGPDLTCDLDTLTCIPREGTGLVDDPCASDETCSPGLLCFDGRCRSLCDPELDTPCAETEVCVQADDPIPGVCRETCGLVEQDCTQPGDACNTAFGPGFELVAVCTQNPGSGVEGEPCQIDGDCASTYLCTDAADHSFGCINDASACCSQICDPLLLSCSGVEQICVPLGIAGQPEAGYCGV